MPALQSTQSRTSGQMGPVVLEWRMDFYRVLRNTEEPCHSMRPDR
jgi:hypothetical protein